MNSRPTTPYYEALPRTPCKGFRRGGTAVSEKNLVNLRKPASSHKFHPAPYVPHSKLALKGAGWSSHQARGCKPLKAFAEPPRTGEILEGFSRGALKSDWPGSNREEARPPTRYRTAAGCLESGELFGETLAGRPQSGHASCQHEVPLLVTREVGGKRRIFSAHRGGSKVKPVGPPKAGKVPSFCSSLDQEFLALFD